MLRGFLQVLSILILYSGICLKNFVFLWLKGIVEIWMYLNKS